MFEDNSDIQICSNKPAHRVKNVFPSQTQTGMSKNHFRLDKINYYLKLNSNCIMDDQDKEYFRFTFVPYNATKFEDASEVTILNWDLHLDFANVNYEADRIMDLVGRKHIYRFKIHTFE